MFIEIKHISIQLINTKHVYCKQDILTCFKPQYFY